MPRERRGFDAEEVEVAKRVDAWTVRPAEEAWFVSQVDRVRSLLAQHRRAHSDWQRACLRRAVETLRSGQLHEPRVEQSLDDRDCYDIEVWGPPGLRKLAERADAGLTDAQARRLRQGLLAILDDPQERGAAYDRGFVQKDRMSTSKRQKAEFRMWLSLPDPPVDPTVATGADFAGLPREDQVAIAATVLLSMHARVLPDHRRLPRSRDRVMDVAIWAMGEAPERSLTGLLNLVEAALSEDELTGSGKTPTFRPWAPPAGYIGTTKIEWSGHAVPATTIASWRNRHPAAFEKSPSTGEWFHPPDWVAARLKSYQPNTNPVRS